jgi:hypothetical protein
MSITAARQAKADTHLSGHIRTTAYGVVTRKERLEKALANGARLELVMVRDEARERAIERELHQLRDYPFGNECHPTTIKVKALKAELAAKPMTEEYRLMQSSIEDGEYWNVLTKTEYQYALTVTQ